MLGHIEQEPLTDPPTDCNGLEISDFNQQEPTFRILRKTMTDKDRWILMLSLGIK